MTKTDINEAIGKAIKRERKAHHMTQEQLAAKVGISRPVLTKYELGQVEISMKMFVRICDEIGVNYADILRNV